MYALNNLFVYTRPRRHVTLMLRLLRTQYCLSRCVTTLWAAQVEHYNKFDHDNLVSILCLNLQINSQMEYRHKKFELALDNLFYELLTSLSPWKIHCKSSVGNSRKFVCRYAVQSWTYKQTSEHYNIKTFSKVFPKCLYRKRDYCPVVSKWLDNFQVRTISRKISTWRCLISYFK